MGWFLFVGLGAVWVLLLTAAIVEDAALAVVASLVAWGWVLGCLRLAHRWAPDPAFARLLDPARSKSRWSGDWWLVLVLAALVSPVATHWVFGKRRAGSLRFGDADPETLALAQQLGWGALVVLVVGCPLAYVLGRRSRAHPS